MFGSFPYCFINSLRHLVCALVLLASLQLEEPREWHFTLRGPPDSPFEGGLYHGRIVLPKNYPFAPPSLMLLTRNGRFDINKKVRLLSALSSRWRSF